MHLLTGSGVASDKWEQGDAGAVSRHPRRLARGGDLADVGQPRPADLFGDRTNISRPSLMQDGQYRLAVAWQNTAAEPAPLPESVR
jgi:hypothetical protein